MKILMVLSTTCSSPRTVARTLELAREPGAEVIGLFVVDPGVARKAADHLADTGFVGEQPSQRVLAVIEEEYRRQGEKKLDDAAERFAEAGVAFRRELREGSFAEICREIVARESPEMAVVCARPVSSLRRWLLGSRIDAFVEHAGCPVELVEERDSRSEDDD